MNKYLKITIILLSIMPNLFGQSIWNFNLPFHLEASVNELSLDSLKSIIQNDTVDANTLDYHAVACFLYKYHRNTETQFLLENLNTKIDTFTYTDSDPNYYYQCSKYYTDTYIKGLLGDQTMLIRMDSIARFSSRDYQKDKAVYRLTEAGRYDFYDYIKNNFLRENSSWEDASLFALYGKDNRFSEEIRTLLEDKVRSQESMSDVWSYASYIGYFDYPLYIEIMNDYFETKTGDERYDYFVQLGVDDMEGQPERTIFAIESTNDPGKDKGIYIPQTDRINGNWRTKRYQEPFFVKYMSELEVEDTTSYLYTKKIIFMDEYEPNRPDSTEPTSSMLDTLTSYTTQSYGYEWLKDEAYKTELLTKLTNAKTKLTAGDSLGCRTEVASFQNSVNQVYQDSSGSYPKYVSDAGYKFMYHYAQYILDRLPEAPTTEDLPVKLHDSQGNKKQQGDKIDHNTKEKIK